MPRYGRKSKAKLETCHKDLQEIFNEVIKVVDISILEGHRGKELQNLYFDQGKSKIRFPNGKHNQYPSRAVDSAPWPIDWNDFPRFAYMAGVIAGIAHMKNIKIRQGIDWNGNKIFDENFIDGPHTELA